MMRVFIKDPLLDQPYKLQIFEYINNKIVPSESRVSREWLIQQYRTSERLSLRFYIRAGEWEKRNVVDMLLSARHLPSHMKVIDALEMERSITIG